MPPDAPTLDRLAINQITTRQWRLADAIAGYARHGVHAISVWRDKLAECGRREAARLLDDHGMRVVALTAVRVPTGSGAAADRAMDEIARSFDEAVDIRARSLVMLAGLSDVLAAQSLKSVLVDRLRTVKERAPPGLQLVLEPLHPVFATTLSPLTSLGAALDICDAVPGIGVAVDVFNVWWDWQLESQIARAGARLQGFHVSDWLPQAIGDLRYNRGMMGDGCIDIRRIRGWMDAAGYRGGIEVEIFSEHDWWRREPVEVVRTCIERFKACC